MCSIQRQNGFYSAMAGLGDKNGNSEFSKAVRAKMVDDPASSTSAPSPALAPEGRQASRQSGGATRQNVSTSLGGSTVLTSDRGGLTAAPTEKKTLLGQ
ncbi:hypothetical protein [Rhizobium lentis]|uniref:hypothetical protein n=1 Tax=Rhizobium lentis TaxID=1138194 RepID=UPI001C8286BB|nr:hypothetical protein [Rhizobium lentis]MBX5020414.1 hypothetical protein [Rhizobium lentis]